MAKTLVRRDNNSTYPTVHADPHFYEESYFPAIPLVLHTTQNCCDICILCSLNPLGMFAKLYGTFILIMLLIDYIEIINKSGR